MRTYCSHLIIMWYGMLKALKAMPTAFVELLFYQRHYKFYISQHFIRPILDYNANVHFISFYDSSIEIEVH